MTLIHPWIIDFPTECEVVQRNDYGWADLEIRVFDTKRRRYKVEIEGVAAVDLRFGGSSDPAMNHVGSGILRQVPVGNHRLIVHGEDVTKVLDHIGVGDVHGAIGQSHTSGRSWTLFRSMDGRTKDPTNLSDAWPDFSADAGKFNGEYNPDGLALGSWMPGLGDFLTQHWGVPQRFLNYAVGGSLTSVWQPTAAPFKRAVHSFNNAGARYVMYTIGASDAIGGAAVGQLKEMMKTTIYALQDNGFHVLLGCMPFGFAEKSDWNQAMTRQQQAVRELWDEIPGLSRGADLSKLNPTIHVNKFDGVHLNKEGYRKAISLWSDAYRELPIPRHKHM
jgi:hypothetical protein